MSRRLLLHYVVLLQQQWHCDRYRCTYTSSVLCPACHCCISFALVCCKTWFPRLYCHCHWKQLCNNICMPSTLYRRQTAICLIMIDSERLCNKSQQHSETDAAISVCKSSCRLHLIAKLYSSCEDAGWTMLPSTYAYL